MNHEKTKCIFDKGMKPIKKLDIEIAKKLCLDGYINTNVHLSGDLTIYNYTKFDNTWRDYPRQFRGLIADKKGNIVTMEFPKNLRETLHCKFFKDVYDKLDGYLGILYEHDDLYHIFIIDSFTSTKAIYAIEILSYKMAIENTFIHTRYEIPVYIFECHGWNIIKNKEEEENENQD